MKRCGDRLNCASGTKSTHHRVFYGPTDWRNLIQEVNNMYISYEEGKDKEMIQSSATPDPRHHIGK